ncbi:hypothetical protein K469DRAFT_757440 [Zopfia rhizophila CBS 207.26]|uniref:tyrosinase n=1 Tax=Zopfia rhizophila CBS 207.26 TaxID=1314779 RepID=A0A6A6EYQ9_9PEZI|nr:hypothetical protein K469DRAFT_757440 [Zopfia rhizophila CBS 207.26]
MARMTFASLLSLLISTSLFLLVDGIPASSNQQRCHILEEIQTIKARQDGRPAFSVLDVDGLGGTTVHQRLEIRQLEQNPDHWNVYLLRLLRFQSMSQADKLLYYQTAGIHGQPYVAWDGVQQVNGGFGVTALTAPTYFPNGIGHISHSLRLVSFPSPPPSSYSHQLQEIIYLNARQAVSEFSDGEQRIVTGTHFQHSECRTGTGLLHHSSGQGAMPSSIQRHNIDIMLLNRTTSVSNPLSSYTFYPLRTSSFAYDSEKFSTRPSTIRFPSSEEVNVASRNDLVALEMDQNRANLRSRFYSIFMIQHDYFNGSNDLGPGDSLKSVHDTIHNTVGKGGYVTEIPYSAFDTVFWFHHTNVGRMFAIWQALNPDSYATPQPRPYATIAVKGSEMRDTKSPTEGKLVEGTSLNTRAVAGALNFSSQRQYIANIKVHKFGLSDSFNVYIFLGDRPGSDPSSWAGEKNFVGVSGIFTSANAGERKDDVEANGAVPLTAALESKLRSDELESLSEDVVGKHLKD